MAAQSDMSSIWNVRVVSINGLKLTNKQQKQTYKKKAKKRNTVSFVGMFAGVYLVRIEFLILSLEAQFFVRERHLQLMSLTTSICKGKITNLSTAGGGYFAIPAFSHKEFLKTVNPLLYPPGAYSFQARLRGRAEQREGGLFLCPHGKLPTYPSPNPKFCPKWEVSVNVGLGYC